MRRQLIYQNGSGEMHIEFDGEYFLITQEIYEVEKVAVSVTKAEIEEMLLFANEVTR